jgi:hypothetical protein
MDYGEHVRRLRYDERTNVVALPIIELMRENCPRPWILPYLTTLSWTADSLVALECCNMFLSPEVDSFTLEVGYRVPLSQFLFDLTGHCRLTTFHFTSPSTTDGPFTNILASQKGLEKLSLVAPGALSSDVGKRLSSLPYLQSLRLDLSSRSVLAVENFFEEVHPSSGASTPSSIATTDSGVFSADELDFSSIKKSVLRVTGDLRAKRSFSKLNSLHLTGDASNIAVFLKHISSPLTQLDLYIEDPPDRTDWNDLANVICERFGDTLRVLRFHPTASSRLSYVGRPTSNNRLDLTQLALPSLTNLEIDLPSSTQFFAEDIRHLAKVSPELEELKLSPLAQYPLSNGPPSLGLEDLAPLAACKRLQQLAVAVNAQPGSPDLLSSVDSSIKHLLYLHVGHSWIRDPFHVSILLSKLAPSLLSLKWFHERSRPGYIEQHAMSWREVDDTLPHLQRIRSSEREVTKASTRRKEQRALKLARRVMIEKGVLARPQTLGRGIQCSVALRSFAIQATPCTADASVEAAPQTVEKEILAVVPVAEKSLQAKPIFVSTSVDAATRSTSASTQTPPPPVSMPRRFVGQAWRAPFYIVPSIFSLIALAWRILVAYPLSFPSQIVYTMLHRFQEMRDQGWIGPTGGENSTETETMQVCD